MKNLSFSLKNISLGEIDVKFNFKRFDTANPTIKELDNNMVSRTKIVDSNKELFRSSQFSFIDESKKDHVCVVTMRNYLNEKTLPKTTPLHCFWCRHGFSYHPIGCPIEYRNGKMYKKYYSEITKTRYVLQENVTTRQMDLGKQIDQTNFELDSLESNHYLIDGLFCSFNCCYAFILSEKKNPFYRNSLMYLKKIYHDIFQEEEAKLLPAPSWRLLKDYGGDLTIDEFRQGFSKVDFTRMEDYMAPFPECKSVGMLFEKKIRL